MRGMLLWWRRSWFLGPVFFVCVVANWIRTPLSFHDWSWMISVVQGSTMLMSPLAAGATAWLIHTNLPPEVALGLQGLRRPWRPAVHVASAVTAWAWLALLTGLLVGAGVSATLGADPHGLTLPWQLFTGPVAILAAVSLGAMVITLEPGILTIPILVVGVFAAHAILFELNLPQLFSPDFATGKMTPWRPRPSYLVNDIVSNLVLTSGLGAVLVVVSSPRGTRPLLAVVLVAMSFVALLGLVWFRISRLSHFGLYE